MWNDLLNLMCAITAPPPGGWLVKDLHSARRKLLKHYRAWLFYLVRYRATWQWKEERKKLRDQISRLEERVEVFG
jgi:hypothetical protein